MTTRTASQSRHESSTAVQADMIVVMYSTTESDMTTRTAAQSRHDSSTATQADMTL
jgi:hypothetical protein